MRPKHKNKKDSGQQQHERLSRIQQHTRLNKAAYTLIAKLQHTHCQLLDSWLFMATFTVVVSSPIRGPPPYIRGHRRGQRATARVRGEENPVLPPLVPAPIPAARMKYLATRLRVTWCAPEHELEMREHKAGEQRPQWALIKGSHHGSIWRSSGGPINYGAGAWAREWRILHRGRFFMRRLIHRKVRETGTLSGRASVCSSERVSPLRAPPPLQHAHAAAASLGSGDLPRFDRAGSGLLCSLYGAAPLR
jgi:hypothetical protein